MPSFISIGSPVSAPQGVEISTPWGAETGEPIDMKLGVGDYVGDPTPHAQNENCT